MKTISPPYLLDPADVPDTSLLVTHDGKPVDNLFVEKQYRLLTEPLWTSWKPSDGKPYRVLANVGLFFKYRSPPLVPDVMFAVDADTPADSPASDHRSYFVWVTGKPPDVVIEIVSDKRGREDTDKMKAYQQIGVPFYVVFDPDEILDGGVLRVFGRQVTGYRPMNPKAFGELGLGLTLWDGVHERMEGTWLRWIDEAGKLIPNAKERAALEMRRAKTERKRALAQKKKATEEKKRAEEEKKRADAEKALGDAARARVEHLEKKLRAAGLSTNGVS